MFVPRRQFRSFFAGRLGATIAVASIPEDVRKFLPAMTHEVRMEINYARKLLVEKKLTYENLYVIQEALNDGYCAEGKNRNHLDFLYFDKKGAAWILVIKSARSGTEVWFCTLFYTNREKYYISKFKKQRLLREHSGLE